MSNAYDHNGQPTQEGLALLARLLNGKVINEPDAFPCIRFRTDSLALGGIRDLYWDSGWYCTDSTAWKLAVGSFYAQYPDGGGFDWESKWRGAIASERNRHDFATQNLECINLWQQALKEIK